MMLEASTEGEVGFLITISEPTMPSAKLYNGRRTRAASSRAAFVGALAVAGLGSLACAAHHPSSDAPSHAIAVRIQNNLGMPAVLTVFMTHDQGGMSQLLGTVPGGRIETFAYTPVAWDVAYRLVATYGSSKLSDAAFTSPRFNLQDANTGAVVWDLQTNQVQVNDLPVQQVPAKDATKAGAPSGS